MVLDILRKKMILFVQNAMTSILRSNATNAANHCTMTQMVEEGRTQHQPRLSPARKKNFMSTVTLARLQCQ